MNVAIVDLGTNTCRLFLARVEDAIVEAVERVTTVVRLGQGVDATGRLHADAVARTRDSLAGYASRIEAFGPSRRLLIGTSVLRDALDGGEFLASVERDFALPWRLLDGEEEGALAFRGGTGRLAGQVSSPDGPRRHRRRQHRVLRRGARPRSGLRPQPGHRRRARHGAVLP